jgi:hypothetical protein
MVSSTSCWPFAAGHAGQSSQIGAFGRGVAPGMPPAPAAAVGAPPELAPPAIPERTGFVSVFPAPPALAAGGLAGELGAPAPAVGFCPVAPPTAAVPPVPIGLGRGATPLAGASAPQALRAKKRNEYGKSSGRTFVNVAFSANAVATEVENRLRATGRTWARSLYMHEAWRPITRLSRPFLPLGRRPRRTLVGKKRDPLGCVAHSGGRKPQLLDVAWRVDRRRGWRRQVHRASSSLSTVTNATAGAQEFIE